MTLAAIALLSLVFGLLMFDWSTQPKKNRRALSIQGMVFVTGAFFIVFPARATMLAHMVGINRGVDFLLYPIVIWLVRESLLSRRCRHEDAERIAQLTRALAIAKAERIDVPQSIGAPAQSAEVSASWTT
ncbi:MAG: DUF2304 domain-containing protein [Polyangiaceae bacterium]